MRQRIPTSAGRRYGSAADVLGGSAASMWITWMTCGGDGYEHAVADEAIIAGKQHRSGIYGAMCGHAVLAQALVAPPGRRCLRCLDSLPVRRVPHKKARRKGRLCNLFRKSTAVITLARRARKGDQ